MQIMVSWVVLVMAGQWVSFMVGVMPRFSLGVIIWLASPFYPASILSIRCMTRNSIELLLLR